MLQIPRQVGTVDLQPGKNAGTWKDPEMCRDRLDITCTTMRRALRSGFLLRDPVSLGGRNQLGLSPEFTVRIPPSSSHVPDVGLSHAVVLGSRVVGSVLTACFTTSQHCPPGIPHELAQPHQTLATACTPTSSSFFW
jgi:hypothetical protein